MPLFDLILLTVTLVSIYLGVTVLRRFGAVGKTFGGMLIIDGLVALIALGARRGDAALAEPLGVVAIGGAICLIAVPPLLRDLARRALIRDQLRLARTLVDLRELLQPNMGSKTERELIDTIIAVRGGAVDEAVGRLEQTRAEVDPSVRWRIDERIVMTYLYAREWERAIEAYENADGVDNASPQLTVEMIRAYGEVGDLEKAATMVEQLEGSALADEPMLAGLLFRARMMFLAFVGRTGAVEAIVAPRGPLMAMPQSARSFWSGVARLRAGDRSGAKTSLGVSIKQSRDKRARELAQQTLARVDEPGVAGPHSIPARVAALADQLSEIATRPLPEPESRQPRLVGVALARIWVTAALVAANLGVAAAMWLVYRSTSDLGALVVMGANVKSATTGGEPWRLVTYMFVHVGLLHLLVNAYGLWVLGKVTEQLFGWARFLAIYVGSGIAGGVASTYLGAPGISAGASGAVFGLLGAAVVELGLHRDAYSARWTGSLVGLLLLLCGANIVVGFVYPQIDQAAHLGGLGAGALLGLALSRRWSFGERAPVSALGVALGIAAIAAIAWGAFMAATADFGETLAAQPRAERGFDGATAELPGTWSEVTGNTSYDPSQLALFSIKRVSAKLPLEDAVFQLLHDEQFGGAKDAGFKRASRADPRLGAPEPWRSEELLVFGDMMGGERVYRVLVFGRTDGKDDLILGVIYVPEHLVDILRPLVYRIISSIERGPRAKPAAEPEPEAP